MGLPTIDKNIGQIIVDEISLTTEGKVPANISPDLTSRDFLSIVYSMARYNYMQEHPLFASKIRTTLEIAAMGDIATALSKLDQESIVRVLTWVWERFTTPQPETEATNGSQE